MSDTNTALARKVWDTLSQIDVTPHIEYMKSTGSRPAMRYLPWSKAWALFKEHFPYSWYVHLPDVVHSDGTMEVEVRVMVAEGDAEFATGCRLAVMDNVYRAISEPHARDINDNRQRCLVKALAFAGLGLNLWSDSDVPVGLQGKPITEVQAAQIKQLLKRTDSDEPKFLKWAQVERIEDISSDRFHLALTMLEKKLK